MKDIAKGFGLAILSGFCMIGVIIVFFIDTLLFNRFLWKASTTKRSLYTDDSLT